MKKLLIISLSLIFTFAASTSYGQYDPKAKNILDAMSKKYSEIHAFTAKFSYSLNSPAESLEEKFEGEITVKENKYHLNMGEQEIYNNEQNVWTYLKPENEVTITEYEPDPEDILPTEVPEMYKNGYKYLFVEDKIIEGRAYEIVELNPEDKDLRYYKIRLTIDKNDKTLRSYEMYEKGGRRYLYTIKDFKPTSTVSDQDFVFNTAKYPKVEVIDLR